MERVIRILKRMRHATEEEARDATHLAAMRIIRSAVEVKDVGGLLHRAAVNCLKDARIKEGRYRKRVATVDIGATKQNAAEALACARPDEEPPQAAMIAEQARVGTELQQAMQCLSAADRALLEAHYFEGQRLVDIDRSMGMPVGRSKGRLFRARARVLDILNEMRDQSGQER